MVACEADAGNEPIVESAFDDIIVFGFAVEQEHAPVPIDIGYGSTCLAVSLSVGSL